MVGWVVTWNYRPGSFTPLTQSEHIPAADLAEAPQEQIDRRFYAIVTDLVGSPTELTDPDGTLAGHQQHTLWGNTAWRGRADTPLRFPGQYADPETGLHYNQHRYYDPEVGAYLTPDPLGLAAAPNPHAYVMNPQVLADPLGLAPYDADGRSAPTRSFAAWTSASWTSWRTRWLAGRRSSHHRPGRVPGKRQRCASG